MGEVVNLLDQKKTTPPQNDKNIDIIFRCLMYKVSPLANFNALF